MAILKLPRRLPVFALVAALSCVLAVVGGLWIASIRTPEYSLTKALDAARKHDLETFRQYVDIEGVAKSFVDEQIGKAMSAGPGKTEAEQAGRAIGMAIAAGVAPSMIAMFVSQVEHGVETGDFQGKMNGDWSIAGITRDGKTAKVALVEKKRGQIVDLLLRDKGWHWQVFAVRLKIN